MPERGHRREDLTASDLRFWAIFSYLIAYRPGSCPLESYAACRTACSRIIAARSSSRPKAG